MGMANQIPDVVADQQLKAQRELPVQPLHFQQVTGYTTFKAEYAIVDGDIVFHFFVTDEIQKLPDPREYWLKVFPAMLEPLAKEYFKADYPRLQAAYVEEQASWWMRSFGSGMVLEPHKLAHNFFDKLDAAIDTVMKSGTTNSTTNPGA